MESVDWIARPGTILKAIETECDAKYPRFRGRRLADEMEWHENHQACLKKLTDLFLSQRVG